MRVQISPAPFIFIFSILSDLILELVNTSFIIRIKKHVTILFNMNEEQKTEPSLFDKMRHKRITLEAIVIIVLFIAIFGIGYWHILSNRIYIEKAEVYAPIITFNTMTPGVLEKVYVQEGDFVSKSKKIAKVGGLYLKAKTPGIIVSVKNTPGQFVSSQDAIAKMINLEELHVVGRVEEDKGLRDIKPGQQVIFTVDAFGSKEYTGVVDIISPIARQSDIVFSISDKREEKQFEVKVKYDIVKYPELLTGMSARMWIYK